MIRNHILKNQNSGHPDFTILRSGTLSTLTYLRRRVSSDRSHFQMISNVFSPGCESRLILGITHIRHPRGHQVPGAQGVPLDPPEGPKIVILGVPSEGVKNTPLRATIVPPYSRSRRKSFQRGFQ